MARAADAVEPRVHAIAAALCGARVDGLVPAGGGGNSRIYRVDAGGRRYALKSYPPKGADPRDRLGVEWNALRFMAERGIATVPHAYACDREQGFALFEWIDGGLASAPGESEIDQAVAFLGAIGGLTDGPEAAALPAASEACLSGAEIIRQIDARRGRFADVLGAELALAAFLQGSVVPGQAEFEARARAGYGAAGLDFDAALEPGRRALIPADFGFHNAMMRPDGRLIFIDFEYFGWDDPVKVTADFLLHPAMVLSEPLKRRFGVGMCRAFARDATFPHRLRLLYPLFAMRWCLILLNEYLPEHWARRAHAGAQLDWQATKARQLGRAERLFETVAGSYKDFAYGN